MTLIRGSRLGPYEVAGAIGSGGMGEVFRARDTRLNREVAIKVLPEAFADDPERLARFTREAQTLASLNHPNIAGIYGIEEVASAPGSGHASRALIMELVEGEDLSSQIARGPIPVAEALPIARQIAEALEAAHEQGIVHRDLKPANIKVRSDGTVKVLDFGLAKAMDQGSASSSNPNVSHSPTLTHQGTSVGMIIGTAAYMSPEQAKGKTVDKRADIWAFGVVLYEMLSGKRAFKGDDVSETLASVLKDTLSMDALPAQTPPRLKRLIARCLDRDLKTRLRDIGEARVKIAGIESGAPESTASTPPRNDGARFFQAATAVLLLVALVSTGAWYRARSTRPAAVRFLVNPPENTTFVANLRPATIPALSPDGRTLAFVARDESGNRRLWIRPIDSVVALPLAGTEGAAWPFWSPDSRTIAYSVTGKLMRIAVTGGPPSTLCALGTGVNARGGAWNRDGVIVFNNGPAPLHRVSQSGGTATPMGELLPGEGGRQFPSFLPDGRHLLYYASGPGIVGGLYVASLDGSESRLVLPSDTGGIYDLESGHVLFGRQGTLMAQTFDPRTFALSGDAFPVAERVESSIVPGVVAFSLSDMGALSYGTGKAPGAGYELVWVDRQGKELGTVGPPGNYRGFDLSPDGSRVAVHRHDDNGGDIWITDISRGTTTRLTLNAEQESASPVWSRDGNQIAFSSIRSGRAGIYVKNADGTGADALVYEVPAGGLMGPQPHSFSADGKVLLFGVQTDSVTRRDLWMVETTGARKATPLLSTSARETYGQLSPDGKWLAYVFRAGAGVGESAEVFVQPASGTGGKWAVSGSGGGFPRWRGDSRELFFFTQGGKAMAVGVTAKGTGFSIGTPTALFDHGNREEAHADYFAYAATRDGQRFLISRPVSGTDSARGQSPIVVALNWVDGFKK